MENSLSKYTVSFGLSLALASMVNGLLVITKEKSTAIQTGMQKLTGHHWITHSAIIVVLFFAVGWLLAQGNGRQGIKMNATRFIGLVFSGVAVGVILIVGFYLVGG